ncbi:acyltransferase [Enterobacter ludwigii]|uniref:Acyltransferase n=1 Tax=Enterobacter ludwigii TaxID=299767 RepID=A0AAX3LD39_9ENTR|nr:acyltransferase [Enterobacter ludwigii]MCM7784376.1 acyltransferase [Enterobacter ludwigii]WCE14205.1 acyltransferase [Enterobacter ludwigii]
MEKQQSENGTIYGLQYMRGIAALMVVLFHLKERLPPHIAPFLDNGRGGVDIFFIISGFIIYFITQNSDELNPKTFFEKRAYRILPLYWFIFIISTPLFFESLDFNSIARGFFLMHRDYQSPSPEFNISVVGVAWTLTYEFYFYAIFLVCSLISKRYRGMLTSITLLSLPVILQIYFNGKFSLSSTTSAQVPGNGFISQFMHILSNTMIYEFVLGIALCSAYLHFRKKNTPIIVWRMLFVLVTILSFYIFFHDVKLWFGMHARHVGNISNAFGFSGFMYMALPFVLMFIFYELSRFKTIITPLVFLGDISYSLYLCHWFVNRLFTDYIPNFNGINSFLVILALSFLMAYVCHILIEKPGVKLIRRKHSGPALS